MMAQIEIERSTGYPKCPGCGATFPVLAWFLDSRCRVQFQGHRPSSAPEMAEFAARHAACQEPIREVTAAGVLVVDRRVGKAT